MEKWYVFDFDSTLIQCEALDELAAISLAKHKGRAAIVERIRGITASGMEGKLSIDESLSKRLALISANRAHIGRLVALLKKRITPSFLRNHEFLKANAANIYVVTSGFREYVLPIVKQLGLYPENVLANSFTFDKKGNVTGYDIANPLAREGGKARAVKKLKLKGEVCVIGDGITDYQIKEAGAAEKFFAFTENVEREVVARSADAVVKSFDEFLYFNKLPMRFSFPKSKINVLLLESIHPRAVEALREEGYSVQSYPDAMDEKELCQAIKDVSLLGVRSKARVTTKVLKNAARLMGIGAFCIGTEQIDLDTSAEKGICVFNAPFSNTRSVVELALGEIIMLMRRTFEASSKLHQGIWHKSAAGSYEVRGKKLGIVGYGNIGSQLSVLAENLGMQVYFYDIVDKLALGNARKCSSLSDLLKSADIVTVHVDGRAANRNLIGAKEFALMKKGVVFLNLSRGSIVNIEALVQYVKAGHIAGAALDVYPQEPKGNKEEFVSALRGLPNLILTPHIGGSTLEAQENIADYVSRKLIDYVNSGTTYFSVNFPQIQLPTLEGAHRLLHLHRNVPGILAQINSILAESKINILGQYLKTTDKIGYVITDVNKSYRKEVMEQLGEIPHTIKFRVLY